MLETVNNSRIKVIKPSKTSSPICHWISECFTLFYNGSSNNFMYLGFCFVLFCLQLGQFSYPVYSLEWIGCRLELVD